VGLFVALGILGLDTAVTSLLAGVGIVGLALGFAFQDLASNFIAGVLLSIRRPFVEGDLIENEDHLGTVTEINLRSTRLRTLQGQTVIIPNAEVFTNSVVNYSTGERRVDLRCGVAYGDDLEAARAVSWAAVRSPTRGRHRPVDFYYEEFGDSSIDFVVRFWITVHAQPDFLRARSEAVIAIKKALRRGRLHHPLPHPNPRLRGGRWRAAGRGAPPALLRRRIARLAVSPSRPPRPRGPAGRTGRAPSARPPARPRG
jgi:small conductance mechanosensitive channel